MADAWHGASVATLLRRFGEYIKVLMEFDADHGLGIFGAGHAELTALAAREGLVYKPCGAGGGDIGILLTDDAERADAFIAEALPQGFRPLELRLDEQGVQVSGEDR
jgi:phosphomevalonate kinase